MIDIQDLLKADRLALDSLHDVVWEVSGATLPDDELKQVWNGLPIDIKLESILWGMDTVVRDAIFVHLQKTGVVVQNNTP